MPPNLIKNNKTRIVFNAIFGGVAFCIVFSAASGLLPTFSPSFLILSLAIGFLGVCFSVWWRLSPNNLLAKFLYFFVLTYYFAAIAFRSFAFIVPESAISIGLFMFGTIVFIHSLPIWNPKIARLVREELSAPRTNWEKIIFKLSILLMPIIGIPLYFITNSLATQGESMIINFTKGILGWMVALLMPFVDRSPSSPWEKQ